MRRTTLMALICATLATDALATVYDVGPGQPLASIGAAPWATLMPGDVVRIHYRAEPYREKWVIGRSGTAEAPIVVQGVLGPGGERPIVSGDGAVTPDPLDFWSEPRGVIKIGGASVPDAEFAEWVVIENLEVRSARSTYSFTGDTGIVQFYAVNASPIFVETGSHLTIRNCILADGGNGLFVAAGYEGVETRDIRIERNWIVDNGNVGSTQEHNTYTAAIGIVYDGNRMGPLRAGASGNNLKDRSAGTVVRYNWLEGGNRQLDLVDGEDLDAIWMDPSYAETFVYGNVLIEPDGAGNRQIIHYGGDGVTDDIYRKGILHFFHNTVISMRVGRTSLLRLSTDGESADVRNNVIWTQDAGNQLELLADGTGDLLLSYNWVKPDWVDTFAELTGTITDAGTNIEQLDPLFADAAMQDFRLLEGSGAIDAAGALLPAVLPAHAVTREYLEHQATVARVTADAGPDLGAFETCVIECPEPGPLGGLVSGLMLAAFRRRS